MYQIISLEKGFRVGIHKFLLENLKIPQSNAFTIQHPRKNGAKETCYQKCSSFSFHKRFFSHLRCSVCLIPYHDRIEFALSPTAVHQWSQMQN